MKIAITGGIGSGKSFICQELNKLGIRVFDSDSSAKALMRNSEQVRSALKALIGDNAYAADGSLDKRVVAEFLLQSEANKLAINDIVHPAVVKDFEQSGLDWLESAIYFESEFFNRTHFDHVVCVSAPLEVRQSRIMARDNISADAALEWINAQMPQELIEKNSDVISINDGKHDTSLQLQIMLSTLQYK